MITMYSTDNKKHINIGTSDIWKSVYSTAYVRLGSFTKKVPLAMEFLRSGYCDYAEAMETAHQINLVRDELSKYPPKKAVYDMENTKKKAPWENNLSPVITSCANLFTTADGKDLFCELVSILVYSATMKSSVSID